MEPKRVRAPIVRIVDHGDSTTILGTATTTRFDGDSAALVRAVLQLHAHPITRAELFEALAKLSDDGAVPAAPVDELVALLEREGVLIAARPHVPPPPAVRRVVLCVTGAVAAVDTPLLVRALHGLGCIVRVAMTRTAQRFVSAGALEAITHEPVHRALWHASVPHIALAEWAELVVVAPCSATTLARIAHGDCSDLVSALVTATRAPVMIVPSMNDAMYESPAVQANLATLRAHGRHVVHGAAGVEVAHRPDARAPMFGPAPPAQAVAEIVRHLLGQLAPQLPNDAAGWERLWATTPATALPWHADELEPEITAALDGQTGTLLDLGTGAGTVAIAAARRGFRVTATEVAPSALGAARARAGELPILFVLDDITRPALTGTFDTIVDRGLLHCLAIDQRPAYAAAIARWIAPGGRLLVLAHSGGGRATHPVSAGDLVQLLGRPVRATPAMFSTRTAHLFEVGY